MPSYDTQLDARVFTLAADLLDHRGLLRTTDRECGIWYAHQFPVTDPRRRKGRTSTVGAVASACVHLDDIAAETRYLARLRDFAGVRVVPLIENGRTPAQVADLLRSCARTVTES